MWIFWEYKMWYEIINFNAILLIWSIEDEGIFYIPKVTLFLNKMINQFTNKIIGYDSLLFYFY